MLLAYSLGAISQKFCLFYFPMIASVKQTFLKLIFKSMDKGEWF